jgi:hypothetical protein
MIRFINLTGQIFIDDPEPHFAWFDTITSEFKIFNGSQEWNSWEAFEQDLLVYLKQYPGYQKELTERFQRLYQFKNHPSNSDLSSKE